MTKTHAELEPCAICLNKSLQVDRLKQDDDYFVACIHCNIWTKLCNSKAEAVQHWNTLFKMRVNKETEFLEELKEECQTELKNKLFLREGQIITYEYVLQKIEQFQEEQNQVNDEKSS